MSGAILHADAVVVDALRKLSPLTVTELHRKTAMPVDNIRRSLRRLEARGLVTSNGRGSWRASDER
jgi:DNA-binding IclR family transcriptional regulator